MQGERADSSRRDYSRYPVIAPRQDTSTSSSQPEPEYASQSSSSQDLLRSKLPPRSRSGCWTCRSRKVKCDEKRPTCGQCGRLGHSCDYNPRLAFKDDTPRVLERMQEFTTERSSVWDSGLPNPKYGQGHSQEDLLPAFSALTTDEERERRAELEKAGTYMVIANPRSFASLPEYCEDDEAADEPAATSFFMPESHPFDGNTDSNTSLPITLADPIDPNIIILKTFEDALRQTPLPSSSMDSGPIMGLRTTLASSSHGSGSWSRTSTSSTISRVEEARNGGRDANLLEHYRRYISHRVIHVGIRHSSEDSFEIQAQNFPPLFHAMMAISALSLAHRTGTQSADALDHYQQVLPAMRITVKSEEDSISDGALFTHYLLFLYEIASAGPWESNLWQSHGSTLQRIITRRREVHGNEPHGFLVWIISVADLYALLSGSGGGGFAEFVMENSYVAPNQCLPPLIPGGHETFFPEEEPYFPKLQELNQQVVWLATQVGVIARDLRIEWAQCQSCEVDPKYHDKYEVDWRNRIRGLQALCRQSSDIWETRYPEFWTGQTSPKDLPWRVRGFWDHSYSLYRLCVIYVCTSMYPGQAADLAEDDTVKYAACAIDIINLARSIVAEERWECAFITLSLFLAGVASKIPVEKTIALEMMTALEQHSYGENTTTTRRLLRAIHDKQQTAAAEGRRDTNVDWVEEMRRRGLRLVMWGM